MFFYTFCDLQRVFKFSKISLLSSKIKVKTFQFLLIKNRYVYLTSILYIHIKIVTRYIQVVVLLNFTVFEKTKKQKTIFRLYLTTCCPSQIKFVFRFFPVLIKAKLITYVIWWQKPRLTITLVFLVYSIIQSCGLTSELTLKPLVPEAHKGSLLI